MVKLGELKSYKDLIDAINVNKFEFLKTVFCDGPGTWQHFDVPKTEALSVLESTGKGNGEPKFGFDASSIRGFQSINESDMNVIPDPKAAFADPFSEHKILNVICDIHDPDTNKGYERDPRAVAKRAEGYLKEALKNNDAVSNFGPELEFFIFDGVRFDQNAHEGYFHIESEEGIWNSGKEGVNLGYKPRHKQGYFPVPPIDSLQDLRDYMIKNLENAGFIVEKGHHEVATAGQGEIDFRYDSLTNTADKVLVYKYILKNTAKKYGKTVTFMPKPLFGDNGTGMHTHFSIWDGEENLFSGKDYANLSKEALWAIGGILKHAYALVALTNPTTNSYRRLVPGFEAPVNLSYSKRNRSAGIRIPMYDLEAKTRRLEVRFPDPSCNPYYAFSAILMAGLDGIRKKIDPGKPMDFDQYHSEQTKDIQTTPRSLDEALTSLEKDHEFLFEGDVFTEDIIGNWIEYKRKEEIDYVRLRPVPAEFMLYFDV